MHNVVISGTGLYTPANSISNEELVQSFNAYVQQFNADNAAAIERGEVQALTESSAAFIEKASGIKSRFVMDKDGILDPQRMAPRLPSAATTNGRCFARWPSVPPNKPCSAPARPPPTLMA